MGSYSTFVVKIWADDRGGAMHGQIQHAGTEEMMRFADMDRMLQFILAHLDSQDDAKAPVREGSGDEDAG